MSLEHKHFFHRRNLQVKEAAPHLHAVRVEAGPDVGLALDDNVGPAAAAGEVDAATGVEVSLGRVVARASAGEVDLAVEELGGKVLDDSNLEADDSTDETKGTLLVVGLGDLSLTLSRSLSLATATDTSLGVETAAVVDGVADTHVEETVLARGELEVLLSVVVTLVDDTVTSGGTSDAVTDLDTADTNARAATDRVVLTAAKDLANEAEETSAEEQSAVLDSGSSSRSRSSYGEEGEEGGSESELHRGITLRLAVLSEEGVEGRMKS